MYPFIESAGEPHFNADLQLFLAVSALSYSADIATAFVIDEFDYPESVSAGGGSQDFSYVGDSPIELRQFGVNHISGNNSVDMESDVGGNGLLEFSAGEGTLGTDNVAYFSQYDHCCTIDLTNRGESNAIGILVVSNDNPVDLSFDVTAFSSSPEYATVHITGGITSPTLIALPYSSFSGAVDFSTIESMGMTIEPLQPAASLVIDTLESVSVPEPTSFLLAMFGGLLCFHHARSASRRVRQQ